MSRFRPNLFGCLAILCAAMGVLSTQAQEKKPFLIVTTKDEKPKDTEAKPPKALLRSNDKQRIHLWVHNPTENEPTVEVQLRMNPGDDPLKTMVKLGAFGTEKVEFKPPKDQKPVSLIDRGFEVKVGDADWKPVKIDFWEPSQIVAIESVTLNGITNQLKAKLRAKQIFDKGINVSMVIVPERFKGLKGNPNDGKMPSTVLDRVSDTAELKLDGMEFEPGTTGNGFVYFTVDGVERAFVYKLPFGSRVEKQNGEPAEQSALGVRVRKLVKQGEETTTVPGRYLKPGDELTAVVEINGDGFGDGKVSAALGKLEGTEFKRDLATEEPLPGKRMQVVLFEPIGPRGELTLYLTVADPVWRVPSTKDLTGEKIVRVQVVDKPEIFADTRITFLTKAPAGVQIGKMPDKMAKDNKYEVKAVTEEPNDSIEQVDFFLGKPVEGQIPKGITPVKGVKTKEKGEWSAVLELPRYKTETVSVRFVNKVGLDSFKSADWKPTHAPAGVKLDKLPEKLSKDNKYEVRATTEDPPDSIDKVDFFVGKADSGKVPAGVRPVKGVKDPDRPEWTANVELPPKQKETVTVRFTNKVGVETVKSVEWKPPPVEEVKKDPTTATISGVVRVGESAQPGIEVKLIPSKQGEEGVTTATDAKGKYTFKDVKPGTYTILSSKDLSGGTRKDAKTVTVKAGDKKEQDLSLLQKGGQ